MGDAVCRHCVGDVPVLSQQEHDHGHLDNVAVFRREVTIRKFEEREARLHHPNPVVASPCEGTHSTGSGGACSVRLHEWD